VNSRYIKNCQVCDSRSIKKFYSFGNLPPVNEYNNLNNLAETKYYNTDLIQCANCSLTQLATIVDKKILFSKDYPYTSSTTKILRENFADLALQVKKRDLLKNDEELVLDIGSNDGNLLSNFKNFRILGVTPEKIGKLAIKKGIPTLLRYFDNSTTKVILKKYGKCKIVTATNVFAHIDNPNEIVKNIKKILEDDGVFISESHYLGSLIQTNQYDTVYHEHLRYYSLKSLKYLLNKHGLRVFDCEKILTHGGSIRVYACKSKKYEIKASVKKMIKEENHTLSLKKFNKFKKDILTSKLSLYKKLSSIKSKNKVICGISAPSRASTLINYVGLDHNIIDCIFEIPGSYKIGNYMPGTKIKIVSEADIKKFNPDYLLIFSWHIKNQLKKIFRIKGFKGKFIIPLPQPKVEV
jgi:2-polyprenyl-3-methyl-5-hydroxy-6-metoxy-1,4-benzoquinol methylase